MRQSKITKIEIEAIITGIVMYGKIATIKTTMIMMAVAIKITITW